MEYTDKQIAILKVAEEVISEKGFEAASIREISKRAHINLAMVSYYFGSKEKLIEAMFILRSEEFKMSINSVVEDASLDPLHKMYKLAENYLNKVLKNFSFHKIMIREISSLNSSVVYNQIMKMKTANLQIIDRVIQEGKQNGQFNTLIDTDHVISLINGTVSNYALNEKYYREKWQLDPERTFAEQTKDKIKNQLLHSLKAILLYHE